MNYYDLHVQSDFSEGESSIEDFSQRAKILGYRGICFSENFRSKEDLDRLKEKCQEIGKNIGIEVYLGLHASSIVELKRLTRFRRNYDLLLVEGGNIKLNREAVETPEVDILLHPEFQRRDSGFNHTMAKLARENEVAIEINFREILLSSKNTRAHIISNISSNVSLCRKFKAPIILSSGAYSHLQMKDPKVLLSMGMLLGLDIKESKNCLSQIPERLINKIRGRKSTDWIRPGVEVIK
jgi:ribonuclease P/MRP protein subunit RPP1